MNTIDSEPLFRHFLSRRSWLPILLALLALSDPEFRLLAGPQPRPAVDAFGDPLPDGALARLGTMRWNHGEGLRHLFIAPDGKTIYSEGGGLLRVWDAVTGVERECLAWIRGDILSPIWLENLLLTPDGKKLISLRQGSYGDQNDTVRVWDLAQKKEIRKLALPTERREFSSARLNALSRDGQLCAINLPREMRIFDLATGRELYKLSKGGKEIEDVVFAGDRLVTADAKQKIDIWDARTGKLVRQVMQAAPVQLLAASLDGHWLATMEHRSYLDFPDRSRNNDFVRVWNLSTGKVKHTLAARPKHLFERMSFSADGRRLLTCSYDQDNGSELSIWDVEMGERVRELPTRYREPLALSADGGRLAREDLLGWGKFDLWDVKRGHRLSGDGSRDARASSLAFSPGEDRLVLLGDPRLVFHGDPVLSSWETVTGQRKYFLELLRPNIGTDSYQFFPPMLGLSSDGRMAVSFVFEDSKKLAVVWDVARHRRLHSLKTSYGISAFAPDASLLAIWERGKESVIRLWEVRSGREVRSFRPTVGGKRDADDDGPPVDGLFMEPFLSFTADAKTLLLVDKKVGGYDVASGKELFSWRMNPLPLKAGLPVPVPIGGEPDNVESRQACLGITASPDGALLAAVLVNPYGEPIEERLTLFDARTGKILRRWNDSDPPSSHRRREGLCFSQDSQLLANSDGSVIHLWEAATGKEIRTFRGHRGNIAFLAFSHDDRRLASASEDSTVLLWDMTGQPAKPATLTEEKLKECWKDLVREDAARAHRAVWTLIRASRESIPFLKTKLHPVQPVRREQLDRWIQDLDADTFEVRQLATTELAKLGDLAEPALRRALKKQPTLEQRRRIEPLLAKLDAVTPSGERLRVLRAMRVLGHADAPEARQLLRDLAGGAEGAWLTRQARGALARLNPSVP